MPSTRDNRPNLDILRSLAVLAVLGDHLTLNLQYKFGVVSPVYCHAAPAFGQVGVLSFFVHTSLVLMYSLDRLQPAGRGSVAARFYVRRGFRLYPLSIFCILTALAFAIPSITWRSVPPAMSWQVIASNILLVQNLWTKRSVIGPLWSLPYEVQMYLALPFLHRLANCGRPATVLLAMMAGFCCLGTLIAMASGHLNMAAYVPCFLSGVLCYALRERQRPLIPAWLWPWNLLALFLTYAAIHSASEELIYWVGWVYCLILGLMINMFRESDCHWLNAITLIVAKYSFGIYLWHVAAFYLVFDVAKCSDPAIASMLSIVITLLISVLTYHSIEEPMIGLGRRLTSRGRQGS